MMSATSATRVEQLRDMVEDRAVVLPLTVGKYHQMIADGIVPQGEPFELLNGYVIHKDRSAAGEGPLNVGPEQAWVIRELTALDPRLRRLGCHTQIPLPITVDMLRPGQTVELPAPRGNRLTIPIRRLLP